VGLVQSLKSDNIQEGKDFVGELPITLVDSCKLAYVLFGTYVYSKNLLFLVIIKEGKLL